MEEKIYKYRVLVEYKEGGLEYTVRDYVYIDSEFIRQALWLTEETKNLLTIEKKALTIFKNEKYCNVKIYLEIARDGGKTLSLVKYFNDYNTGANRLELMHIDDQKLKETHKDITIEEGVKLLKRDFIDFKSILKNFIFDIIDEKTAS